MTISKAPFAVNEQMIFRTSYRSKQDSANLELSIMPEADISLPLLLHGAIVDRVCGLFKIPFVNRIMKSSAEICTLGNADCFSRLTGGLSKVCRW